MFYNHLIEKKEKKNFFIEKKWKQAQKLLDENLIFNINPILL